MKNNNIKTIVYLFIWMLSIPILSLIFILYGLPDLMILLSIIQWDIFTFIVNFILEQTNNPIIVTIAITTIIYCIFFGTCITTILYKTYKRIKERVELNRRFEDVCDARGAREIN